MVSASETPIMLIASIMLLQALAAWPVPAGPQCTMVLPIASITGFARANTSSLPPIMKVSVAASAPAVPPETGASRKARPASALSLCTVAMSMVELSIRIAPGALAAAAPPGASSASRTCWPAGSMVMTNSAPCAASAAEPAVAPPSAAKAATASGTTSKPVTWWPDPPFAFSRLRAIGRPILPSPMKPIFAMDHPPVELRRA